MSLRIALLGPPSVTVDGEPLAVDTRKAVAILAYLAVTRRPASRDALVGLLWPASDERRARAALRRTLSTLNSALGPYALRTDGHLVALPEAEVDLDAFEALVASTADHGHPARDACPRCRAPLGEAVDLHRGPFLEGFHLRDSAEFDDWTSYQAERITRERTAAMERLVAALAEAGDLDAAVARAEVWLAVDTLSEPAYIWLIQLHAWTGDRAAAQRRYRECVAVLDRELGVPPLDETTALYHAVLEDRLPERPPPPPEEPPERGPAVPFVGRGAELERLVEVHASAADGVRMAVVSGEAGIGKSRLVEEFGGRVRSKGGRVVAVRCYADETHVAFGAAAELLRQAAAGGVSDVADHWLAEAARLAPEVGEGRSLPEPPPLDSPGAQARFVRGVCEVLAAALAGPVPGLVVVDDVHRADAGTVDVLRHLVRRLGADVAVAVTWRTEEVDDSHPLRDLASDAGAEVVALGRLGPRDVSEIVEAVAPGADPEQLYAETEGLPLVLVAHLTTPGAPTADVFAPRLAAVDPLARQVLTAAAVIGRSFDLDTLLRASGRTEEEVTAALDELVARGLVIETAGPRYDFVHDQLRAAVYGRASLARRRLLHRRVAEALDRTRDPAMAAVAARHHLEAGREAEAADGFRRAGDRARELYAHGDALEHYAAALALRPADTASLHEAIGDLHTLRGDYPRAAVSYASAAALGEPGRLAVLERKLGALHLRMGEWETADAHLSAALEAAGVDARDLVARVHADRSVAARRRGDLAAAADEAARALEAAEAAADARALAGAHNALGIVARAQGDLPRARDHLTRSVELASEVGDEDARVAALNNLALVLGEDGAPEEGLAHARTALGVCAMLGDRHREAAIHSNLADLLRLVGRTDDAMDHLKHSARLFAEVGEGQAPSPEIWKLAEW